MSKSRFRLTHPFKFLVERQFVKGAKYQLLAVVALIGIISLIGGLLAMTTWEDGQGLGESIWWAFLRLTDPGYLGDDEGTFRRILSTLLTVAGYVIFLGALVAIMTQWLTSKMNELEQGLTPVAVKNHIVILGWTDRTTSIIVELFQSEGKLKRFLSRFGTSKLKIVVLAENSSAKLTQELKSNRLIGKRADEIILRTGDPLQADHLLRVDCYNAAAVIIPSHKQSFKDILSADVEVIKTLLSLNSNPKIKEHSQLPYVVAEIQSEKKINIARNSYSGPMEVISGDAIISRLITQNLRHIGLSKVYTELLTRGFKSDLFAREHNELVGMSLSDIELLFSKCIVLGLVRVENGKFKPLLNASKSTVIQKSDRVVFLANNHDDTNLDKNRTRTSHEKNKSEKITKKVIKEVSNGGTKKVLMLGWNNRLPALINELGTYSDIKFDVTVVSILSLKEREKKIRQYGGAVSKVICSHVEADFMEEADLREINPQKFDHILFLSSDLLSDGEEADARTIVGKVLLDEILKEHQKKPQVLLELANPDNNHLIKSENSEVIISSVILSHLLAQVAMRRELQSIYADLFTFGGAEIEFRKLSQYEMKLGEYTFSEIEKITSEFGEIAIGVHRSKYGLYLNPSKSNMYSLTEMDKIVSVVTY